MSSKIRPKTTKQGPWSLEPHRVSLKHEGLMMNQVGAQNSCQYFVLKNDYDFPCVGSGEKHMSKILPLIH